MMIIYTHSNKPVLRRLLELGQYLSIRYTERLAEAGIATSVGSRGDSYDNALAETMNGLYKAELVYRRDPPSGHMNGPDALLAAWDAANP